MRTAATSSSAKRALAHPLGGQAVRHHTRHVDAQPLQERELGARGVAPQGIDRHVERSTARSRSRGDLVRRHCDI